MHSGNNTQKENYNKYVNYINGLQRPEFSTNNGNNNNLIRCLQPSIEKIHSSIQCGIPKQNLSKQLSCHKDIDPELAKQLNENLPFFGISENLKTTAAWAMMYLSLMTCVTQPSETAIVLDIDDTALTLNRGSRKSIRIEPIYELYKYAVSLGIQVYFVTARLNYQDTAKETETELDSLGYNHFRALFLMPPNEMLDMNLNGNYSLYKFRARQYVNLIEKKKILLSIGDNWADVMNFDKDDPEKSEIGNLLTQLPQKLNYILKLPDIANMSIKLSSNE